MSVLNENTIIGASAAGGDYEIEQSLRFNKPDSNYLSRTPSTASNRRTWTWSGWVKLTGADNRTLFSANNPSSLGHQIRFYTNQLSILGYNGGFSYQLRTNQLFRDPSAWYHIVAAIDTTQSTASNRVKMYVNGEQVTSFSAETYPNQNFDTFVNTTNEHYLGVNNEGGLADYFDGYLGEVNFIDGQALTPDSFGETGTYGEWKPIAYAGTYGTNGFFLPFKQDYAVEGFSTVTYEGNGTSGHYIGGTGFEPSLVWLKQRSNNNSHALVDQVRGVLKGLSSDSTAAENTFNHVKSFESDGFTVGTSAQANSNNATYVAWNWDMGGTTASNTNGTITSSVRANTTYGQSIVSYSGTGSAATVGHGLASAPEFWIVKNRSVVKNWAVGTTEIPATNWMQLEQTGGSDSGTTVWNSTYPSSNVISIGTATVTNAGSQDYIAYCFHSVTGYSKFGSYTGNGSTTGPVVTLGFSPAFVMIKRTNASGNSWRMFDNTRNPTNPVDKILYANLSNAETTQDNLEFVSDGLNIIGTSTDVNASGGTYIYMAFADTREYAYWYDQSGNNNDWTSEGGLTESDVMVDSPTNNFCTWNPLDHKDFTFSEGNLKAVSGGIAQTFARATMALTGNYYWEVIVTAESSSTPVGMIGIYGSNSPSTVNVYNQATSYVYFGYNGNKYNNGTATAYGTAYTVGDIIGVTFNSSTGNLVFYKNNVSQGTAYTVPTSVVYSPLLTDGSGSLTETYVANFGQDSSFAGAKTSQGNQDANGIGDFYYAPPTGFLALCTSNLPDVDVIPSEHFNTVLYTGDGSTQSISGVGFQPDFVWVKQRNDTGYHNLADSVRGAGKRLFSNTTDAEDSGANLLSSFNSDGFSVGTENDYNENNITFASWNWKAGGTAVSNTNGSITSSVSANAAAGCSIVSYTGTGANGATVGHGLSVAPELIINKKRNASQSWYVWHEALASTSHGLSLDTTAAQGAFSYGTWGTKTSTIMTASQGANGLTNVNATGDTYISYAFHSVDGYSKVGSYTGNGSADGTFVHCGFRPAYVMMKNTTTAGRGWAVIDAKRDTSNQAAKVLYPDSSAAEDSIYNQIDILATGFKLRSVNSYTNTSGDNYIFYAVAESPFKHTNAR